jgi:hypothetical protein
MASILQDRRLQWLFLFKGTESERRRLDYWLSAALVEGVEDKGLRGLLKICAQFVEFTNECPSCLEGFLRNYLRSWDGKTNRPSIFDLLISIVPTNYDGISLIESVDQEEYRQDIMLPLQAIFDKGDKAYAAALLRYYSRLLWRWATVYAKNFLVGSTPSPLYISSTKSNEVSSSGQR